MYRNFETNKLTFNKSLIVQRKIFQRNLKANYSIILFTKREFSRIYINKYYYSVECSKGNITCIFLYCNFTHLLCT